MSPEVLRKLRAALSNRAPKRLGPLEAGTQRASVLVPFFEKAGDLHLLFVKRPEGDYPHAGQIAFPGGKRESGESEVDCALREAEEEVGIPPATIDLLGVLDECDTITGYRATPGAGLLSTRQFRAHPREVERILEVPLTVLLDRSRFRTQTRDILGRQVLVHYYSVGSDVIWGATAWMLTPLLELIRSLEPESLDA